MRVQIPSPAPNIHVYKLFGQNLFVDSVSFLYISGNVKEGDAKVIMAYTMIGHSKLASMVRKYVVDTYNDIASINISQLLPGSSVLVIDTSKTYMLKHDRTWKEVRTSSSSGGSGDSDVVYDGGDEDNSTTPDSGGGTIYNGGDEDG